MSFSDNKILIFGDLHLHPHRQDHRRAEDGLKCLDWIYSYAERFEIKTVVCCGDFMHHRFSLPAYVFSKACTSVAKAKRKGINTIFLLGNHDMYGEDSWDVHSLTPLMEWSQVIDKPQTIELLGFPVDMLPYTPRPSHFITKFTKPSPVLFSHLSIANAFLNTKHNIVSVEDDTKEKEVLDVKEFSRWKKVWLGHYHYGQKIDNVEYIGSPMQLTFGEAGQTKHIAFFDLKTHEIQYVDNLVSPQFHIIEDTKELDGMQLDDAYIQVRCQQSISNSFELKDKLSKLGVRESEIVPMSIDIQQQTKTAMNNIVDFLNDKNKLIDKYVDDIKLTDECSGLDRDLLKKIGKEIVA